MWLLERGRGRLQRVPAPLRPLVCAILDPIRRFEDRLRERWHATQRARERVPATWAWLRALARDTIAKRRTRGLTVGVDGAPLWLRPTGVGWYLLRLLQELANRPDLRLRVYGPSLFTHPEDPTPCVTLPRGPAIDLVSYSVPDDLLLSRDRLLRWLRRIEPLMVAAHRDRVLFAPNFLPPPLFRWSRGALVATVHDLVYCSYPETMQRATFRKHHLLLAQTVARARRVITDSETIRDELLGTGWCAATRLRSIPLGPGHLRRDTAPSPVAEPFALHVGTVEPRKNLSTLLAAWRLIRWQGAKRLPLALAGLSGWEASDLRNEITRGGQHGWLVRCGYVEDATLEALYRHAILVLCPSIYEGFGLPILEAMATGTPVVCSDIPVFREIAEGAAIFVSPRDPHAWADVVARVVSDRGLRERLAAAGRARAREFSWAKTADATHSVWRQAVGRG